MQLVILLGVRDDVARDVQSRQPEEEVAYILRSMASKLEQGSKLVDWHDRPIRNSSGYGCGLVWYFPDMDEEELDRLIDDMQNRA